MSQPQFEPPSVSHSLDVLGDSVGLSANRQISAEYLLKLGNRHYNHYLARHSHRDLEAAISHYKQALEINTSLPEAYVKLASALWDNGDISIELAIQYCGIARSLKPDYAEASLFLGYFLRQAGQLDEAAAHFREAILRSGPIKAAKARMALGRVLIQAGALSHSEPVGKRLATVLQGLQEFATGCLLLPGDRQTVQVLQWAFWTDLQIFGLTGAGRLLKTVGMRSRTIGLYEWASNHLAQEPIFHHLLGDLHAESRNLDGAIYYYSRAQELDPHNPVLHKKLGRVYKQCNDTANAAKSLEKVVQANVADFDTLYALAQIYTDRGEFMRSLYYFKELMAQAPDNPYIHSNLAYVLFKLEDYDGAVEEYQSAVNFGNDPVWTATVAQTLGTIYYQIKQDTDAAVSMFQLACQLDKSNLDALSMLGDIYTEQGDFEAAIQAYRYILSVEPDNADCYNYLGYLLWQLDKNDEAVEAYKRAIQLDSSNHIAYNNLGVIYLDEKCQPQRALELFETAHLLKPDYTLARFNVGRTLEAMGQTAEAAKSYSEAMTLNAHNPEISNDEIEERLEQLFSC